jgi:hypothetical protein
MILCVDIDKTPNEVIKAYARFKITRELVYYQEDPKNSNLVFKIYNPDELQEVIIDIDVKNPKICFDVYTDCINMKQFEYDFTGESAALQLRYTRELNQSNYISIHPAPFPNEIMEFDEFPTMIRFNFRDCDGDCPPCPGDESTTSMILCVGNDSYNAISEAYYYNNLNRIYITSEDNIIHTKLENAESIFITFDMVQDPHFKICIFEDLNELGIYEFNCINTLQVEVIFDTNEIKLIPDVGDVISIILNKYPQILRFVCIPLKGDM